MSLRAPLLLACAIAMLAASAADAQRRRREGPGDRPATDLHRGDTPRRDREERGDRTTIIGRDARQLAQMFGTARLDLTEGPAHKLQFANDSCVIDAYLYPPRAGAEPVVTHVDARALDGSDVDQPACIALLRRR